MEKEREGKESGRERECVKEKKRQIEEGKIKLKGGEKRKRGKGKRRGREKGKKTGRTIFLEWELKKKERRGKRLKRRGNHRESIEREG